MEPDTNAETPSHQTEPLNNQFLVEPELIIATEQEQVQRELTAALDRCTDQFEKDQKILDHFWRQLQIIRLENMTNLVYLRLKNLEEEEQKSAKNKHQSSGEF